MGRFVAQIYINGPKVRWRAHTIKKEAQIEIQAVAKIQYPIKSHSSKANSSPKGFKGRISGFHVPGEEFRGFFSSTFHEILQLIFMPPGGNARVGSAVGGVARGGLCYRGEFLLHRVV